MRKSTKIMLVCLAVFMAQVAVQAQTTTGSLSGTVIDQKESVVPGATVTLTNNATGAERTAETSSNGTFDFQALQPGTYIATVEAAGFKRAVVRDIVVSVASSAQVCISVRGRLGE